ncbi:hypothetical protein llap_5481 [Limosa lapponica baueri]|uniref:Rna-directed dna polymerase from mobile element jockey-like n=1 Tax=Limosa lapponica baueri TaxID=1758121 RepID=A0A2I0UDV7_LIMLA|nr:hypothetical protein llap_5481 [Limosa lapponica baueri]
MDAIQRDLDRLEDWAHVNFMKFNMAKLKVLYLGWNNVQYQYRLGDEWIKSSPARNNSGIMTDEKLDVSWQCVQKGNGSMDCIKQSMASRLTEVIILPLLPSHDIPPGVLYPVLGIWTN